MTQLEIYTLALEGAREKLRAAAHNFDVTRCRYEKSIDWIRNALADYDYLKKYVEKIKEE